MSRATNKQFCDYEDDEKSDISFVSQDSSFSDSYNTFIVIDDDVWDLSNDDGILTPLITPSMCSWELSVGSDDESELESQTPLLPMLIEDGGVTTEEWLIDEILAEDDNQEM
ncbi:conserved hypothetical protein [Histoplasma capsulatum var. duboisii H88]|uniref:Uncharacterized protein n=1 Tax=Ajellomyces capsulatus (strain H88) TaxID=544711 RepID=F0UT11_AJEC8|nr:conserved hypothetical protein [Histoplasma capsulatum var. duboisii H88]